MITGQVIVRDAGDGILGRRKVMIFGIIDIPAEEYARLKPEHQYTLAGHSLDALRVVPETGKDVSATTAGMLPGQTMTQPIWRT